MLSICLALVGALCSGSGAFGAGVTSRKVSSTVMNLAVQLVGIPIYFLATIVIASEYSTKALGWGVAAGVGAVCSLSLLFIALRIGRISIVMPVEAATSTALPIIWDLTQEESLSRLTVFGLVTLVAAIVCITVGSREDSDLAPVEKSALMRSIFLAMGSGFGLGVYFICVGHAPESAGAWPGFFAVVVGFVCLLPFVLMQRVERSKVQDATKALLLVGGLYSFAGIFFLLATHEGLVSQASVIFSLSPGLTIFLAMVFLRERLRAVQWFGTALAFLGLAVVGLAGN